MRTNTQAPQPGPRRVQTFPGTRARAPFGPAPSAPALAHPHSAPGRFIHRTDPSGPRAPVVSVHPPRGSARLSPARSLQPSVDTGALGSSPREKGWDERAPPSVRRGMSEPGPPSCLHFPPGAWGRRCGRAGAERGAGRAGWREGAREQGSRARRLRRIPNRRDPHVRTRDPLVSLCECPCVSLMGGQGLGTGVEVT